MNEHSKNSQEQLPSELQPRKLESEIARNQAERDKLNFEAKLYAKNVKWYLVKYVAAGIVAAALLTVWTVGYFTPILSRGQEIADLDNRILERRNELQRIENERRTMELVANNDTLEAKLADAINRTEDLQARLTVLADLYDSLSEAEELATEQRGEYTQHANDARAEAESLKSDIAQLRIEKEHADLRRQEILTPAWLLPRVYKVTLVLPSTMSDAEILVDGEPSKILDRTLTVVTILVTEKETNHRITVKKGDQVCTKEQLIRQDNLRLYPCR